MNVPGLSGIHLTYCLNVHPGSTLAEAETAIFEHAPRVFAEFDSLSGAAPRHAPGIWFSAEAARELEAPGRLDAFAARLADAGFYAFTFNGFPYGRFHGTRVKEAVYRPDWADPARPDYTLRLARILARLLPEGVEGTISTLPVTFAPWANEATLETSTRHLADVAAALARLEAETGRALAIALEPEPGCFLERTSDVVAFFAHDLLPDRDEDLLRRHIGVCLDTTHTGVMGEDPTDAVAHLHGAGIRLLKVQLGAALAVEVGPEGPPDALRAFSDDVYLHQVTVGGGPTLFFTDLPQALAHRPVPEGPWRVHFHVPLAWPGEGPVGTTSDQVTEEFFAAALAAGCRHFESEIYTLDVFPAAQDSTAAILARDLAWILKRLLAARP